jgi:hypothetical protein
LVRERRHPLWPCRDKAATYDVEAAQAEQGLAFMSRSSKPQRPPAKRPDAFRKELISLMEQNDTADLLNDKIITPFVSALEAVCTARGYSLNIYGNSSNLVISTEEDAEAIYAMVETYFDEKAAAEAEADVDTRDRK